MYRGFAKLAVLTLYLAAAGAASAFADASTEAQLRSALQSATAQIATLEDQVANLQASQAPDVATIEALRAQLQTLQVGGKTPASTADKAKDDAAMAAMTKQLAARNAEIGKSRTAYQAAESAAGTAAAENTALKAQLAATNSGLASCNVKNTQLVNLANQILDAYSHKDDIFGTIANREPFIGFKRVQLQNIVQDDQNKIYNNQVAPAGAAP